MIEWFVSLNSVWVTMGSVLAVLATLHRFLRPHLLRLSHFYDDWFGAPARPGKAEVLGFPDRMTQMEDWVRSVSESLACENLLNEIKELGKRINRLGTRFDVLRNDVEEMKADVKEFQRDTLDRVAQIDELIAEELLAMNEPKPEEE